MTMKTLTNSHVNGRKQHATCKVNYFFHYQQPSLPPSVAQLQRLLQKPIQFVTATQLTVADEARMQPNSTTSSGDYDENRPDIPGDQRVLQPQAKAGWGFINKLNSCYLNSLVIALLHVPKFVNWLEEVHLGSACSVKHCVACALVRLSLAYWTTRQDYELLKSKLAAFEQVIHDASTTEVEGWSTSKQKYQQDAQEFYAWLLAKLREQNSSHDHLLEDLLVLSVRTNSVCAQCHTYDRKTEPEWQLILSCQDISHINEALDREFASDRKPNIECDSKACNNKRVDKEYYRTLARAPDILCTQFNRFRMDNSGVHKSAQTIHFDQELDLSRFTKRGAPLRYRLMAAVHHRGTSEVGHYISVTRRDQDHWYSQDDDLVTKVSLNDALRPKEEFTPYLLFWAKIPTRKGLQTPLGSKERPHDEMGPPGQDETGQSQSKISSKKRSHEQAKDPTEGETGRPPSKSVKTINAPANTAKDTSRPDLTSPSRWPSNWLWGRSEVANKAQQAEQELSDCKEEHERKDELIKWYKDLMRRAAVTHSQLVASISFLNASYKESRRATDVIHPIMRNIHARGAKHEDKAGKFLELAERARDRRRRGKYHIHTSERLTRLVKPAIEDGLENEAFTAFTTAVEEAMGEDKLEFWLDNELTMSGLPVGDWRSQIRQ